jgi:hypothetical protein
MPNTTEKGEIAARTNAREEETVRQSQKLVSKAKQFSLGKNAKSLVPGARAPKGRSRDRTP